METESPASTAVPTSPRPAGPVLHAQPPLGRVTRVALGVGGLVWLAASAVGFTWLERRSITPAANATPPPTWPADTSLPAAIGQPIVVMFVHPHCPCTRASVAELERLLAARPPRRLRVVIVMYAPDGVPDDWARSDRWRQAAAIPGAVVVADPHEAERARFGVATSGQVVAYDATGRLAFRGGLTPARGRSGGGPGRAALEALLDGRTPGRPDAPVFGCPLTDDPPAPGR